MDDFQARHKAEKPDIDTAEASLPFDVNLATSLFEAGRLTKSEFVFYCGNFVVSFHERKHIEGRYDDELKPVLDRMDAIERACGLKKNEYWLVDEAPLEYQIESEKYDSILKRKQSDTFRKYAPSLSKLLENDSTEFWRLYEIGRRSVFEGTDHLASILELIDLYESEAKKCAATKAYYAANSMLGSASEARLILECLRQPSKVKRIISSLPKKQRPNSANPLDWNLNLLMKVAEHAGWLPNIDDGELIFVVSVLAHRLRSMRNFIHPGRHALDKPHARLGEEEWRDAWSGYIALRHSIERARQRPAKRKA